MNVNVNRSCRTTAFARHSPLSHLTQFSLVGSIPLAALFVPSTRILANPLTAVTHVTRINTSTSRRGGKVLSLGRLRSDRFFEIAAVAPINGAVVFN